jgi:hypothetical protein
MIQRLITTLQALAAPAETQRGRFRELGAKADEVALDYADAWLTARQCPGLEWTVEQQHLLDELDTLLAGMSGQAHAALWTDEALRQDPEWARVRAVAKQALLALGVPLAEPTSDVNRLPG